MIQLRTILNVADNTGAKKLMVFHIYGGHKRSIGRIGDVVMAAVKEAVPEGIVKDAEKVRAVVVRTKKEKKREDGSYIRFDDNAAVIIDANGLPRGTRILGPIAREIKQLGYAKIASLALEVL